MQGRQDIKKVLIIGSGPIIIGQACEFDYSGTQACKALRSLGYEIVLVNSNPATIMTDPNMADHTYIEPLNVESLEKIIAKERPDALLPNLGGQMALNLSADLAEKGILAKYNVQIIGVKLDAIKKGEDRQTFKDTMESIGVECARSAIARSYEEAEKVLETIKLPVVIRPAYTMGGTGGGLVYNMEEFKTIANRGLNESLVHEILIEECLAGWEELELEIIRDSKGQKITVCFIENVDPMGVHTGDSYCTAPMMTVPESLQKRLQKYSYDIVDAIEVIGGTNVQFAHDPVTDRVVVIEINPRTSRSSALASKATGFPIAFISAYLAAGITLDQLPYWKEGTLDKYVPSGDYVVVKFARWAFEKFHGSYDKLGTQMRAVGEVMSIGKNYKEAFQKAIRSLENKCYGLGFYKGYDKWTKEALVEAVRTPCSTRQFMLYEAVRKGATVDELHEATKINKWFLTQMKELVELEEEILKHKGSLPPKDLLIQAKKDGFSDRYLAQILGVGETEVREAREADGMEENWFAVPVSGVKDACYYYSTYNAKNETKISPKDKIMVLGGGPNRIGQGIEFDYCCVHAAFAIRDAGLESVMVNCNPETVSTDYDTSNKLYFEPLTLEDVLAIYRKEKPVGVIVQFGGQTPLNLAHDLEANGVKVLGTSPKTIALAEDRELFHEVVQKLGIPQPEAGMAHSVEDALEAAKRIGYPLMVRPSFVLGGRGMEVVHNDEMLVEYMNNALQAAGENVILIDKFLENATETEADAICDGKEAFVPAIMEHIEQAGIHSGDSACFIPPVTIPKKHIETIERYTKELALEMHVVGLMNVQYAICNDVVYILEANPRASRTVPLVSKVCSIPMARIATQVMLGKTLKELGITKKAIPHYGVKEAVFPFNMFPEVDPVLGPEMRSTGEVLGISTSPGLAYFKSQVAANQKLPTEGTVLMTVADHDGMLLETASLFKELGFKILATKGTCAYLKENGIEAETVLKRLEGRPNLVDAITNGEVNLIVNTPIGCRSKDDDSYIRKTAIKYKVPYITTMTAAHNAALGIKAFLHGSAPLKSIQEYHADIK
ncbi:carbamoyl-phosphate synthase large subunit [bacterium]|nr:carbamoyl-phosphate synthase large subunit [bacterium]